MKDYKFTIYPKFGSTEDYYTTSYQEAIICFTANRIAKGMDTSIIRVLDEEGSLVALEPQVKVTNAI